MPVFATLFSFTILSLFAITLIWRQGVSKKYYYIIFCMLGLFAILTVNNYLYPKHSVFKNIDYHILEHLGFEFQNTLTLVDDQNPEYALWDNKKGNISVIGKEGDFQMQVQDFYEPLFIQSSKNKEAYHLSNNILNLPISDTLSIAIGDSLVLTLNMQETLTDRSTFGKIKKRLPFIETLNKDTVTYIFFLYKNGNLEAQSICSYSTRLQVGYPIRDLIRKSTIATHKDASTILNALGSAALTRKIHYTDKDIFNDSPLFLFPDSTFAKNILSIANKDQTVLLTNQALEHEIEIPTGRKFYTGLGLYKSETYQLVNQQSHHQLYYEFSKKHHLKNLETPNESLFMTSSSEEVVQSSLTAGYHYPLLVSSNSIHHFYAGLKYYEGTSQNEMLFRIVPYDQELEGDKTSPQMLYQANQDTIKIEAVGTTASDLTPINWLFRFQDLRASNPLQYQHIIYFLLSILGFIFMNITWSNTHKIELTIYIVLFTLLTIRSILLWRMSTFVPIDDITIKVFDSLRTSSSFFFFSSLKYFVETVLITSIFFLSLLGIKLVAQLNLTSKFRLPLFTPTLKTAKYSWLWFFLYLSPIATKLIPQFERFANILVPTVTYFIIDFVLSKRRINSKNQQDYQGYEFYQYLNWLICFGILTLFDAGFGCIFLLFGVIYQVFTTLFQSKNSTKKQTIIWAFTFFILLFFINRVMLFIFNYTTLFSYALIGIFLGMGGYFLRKNIKPKNIFENIYRIASILGIVVGVFLFFSQGKIVEIIKEKEYIKYRTEIHVRDASQIMTDEEFNSPNSNRLLQAAQNQWFIQYHYGGDFWKDLWKGKYFSLTPHFKKGSSYSAQTTDLVTVRYLISEHSEWLVLGIIFLWLFISTYLFNWIDEKESNNRIAFKVSLLFFTITFFIWMTATNRYIFFGQDFPLISLTSKLAIIFPLLSFLGIITIVKVPNYSTTTISYKKGRTLFYTFSLILFLVWLINNNYNKTENFNISDTIEASREEFNELNSSFLQYQEKIGIDSLQTLSTTKLIGQFSKTPRINAILSLPFSKSIFKTFKEELVNHNSPENILHLRNPEGQFYQFAMNNNYYRLKSPDTNLNAWKGHLKATKPQLQQQFVYRANTTNHPVQISDKEITGQMITNAYKERNDRILVYSKNVQISIIPSTWTLSEQPLIMINKTEGQQANTKYQFSITNNQEYINSKKGNKSPYAIHPNDAIKIIDQNGKYTKIRYNAIEEQYLAKNIWLNGKQQLFYPLGDQFMWAYNYANLLKNTHTGVEKQDIAVNTSIDYELTKKLREVAETSYHSMRYKKNVDKEQSRAFSLVILDGKGRIKALSDYKKGLDKAINPNNIAAYHDELNRIYLKSSTVTERMLFGNLCLLHISNGPGSSIKPMIYSAVTSQYNLGWENIKFNQPGRYLNQVAKPTGSGRHYFIKQYAGKQIGHWRMLYGHNLDATHDNLTYLYNSSNAYHSLVVFLGSFDKSKVVSAHQYLLNKGNNEIFAQGADNNFKNNFPMINYGSRNYRFKNWPKDFSINSSLLAQGTWLNYNFPTNPNHIEGSKAFNFMDIYPSVSDDQIRSSESMHKLWSHPEVSHFFQIDRESMQAVNGLRQSTVGGYPISITPLKMAEMAGRMTSLNLNYKSTLNPKPVFSPELFTFDDSWGSDEKALQFHSTELFEGLHQVIQKGTGKTLKTITKKYPDYHFYAKTGTINSKFNGIDNTHLLVIISKEQLHGRTDLTEEVLHENKFYVLYFSFFTQSRDWRIIKKTIDELMNSYDFKTYMNETEK